MPIDYSTAARRSAERAVAAGRRRYRRDIHLPSLLRRDAAAFGSAEPEATLAIVEALANAQRRERALAGRWTYDLNRHIGLVQALAAERDALARLKTPLP